MPTRMTALSFPGTKVPYCAVSVPWNFSSKETLVPEILFLPCVCRQSGKTARCKTNHLQPTTHKVWNYTANSVLLLYVSFWDKLIKRNWHCSGSVASAIRTHKVRPWHNVTFHITDQHHWIHWVKFLTFT